MAMPRKSSLGLSKKTSFSLRPDIEKKLEHWMVDFEIVSKSRAIEWAIDTLTYLFEEMDPKLLKMMIIEAARPGGTPMSAQLVAHLRKEESSLLRQKN